MTPREQLNHIDEGDYDWCDECGGSGQLAWFDLGIPLADCHICGGEGIVFIGNEAIASAVEDVRGERQEVVNV